jgi:hypothetical protein
LRSSTNALLLSNSAVLFQYFLWLAIFVFD